MKKVISIVLSVLLIVSFASIAINASAESAEITLQVKNKAEYTKTRDIGNDDTKEDISLILVIGQCENDEANSGKSGVTINSASAYYDAYKSMHEALMNDLPLDFGSIAVVRSDSKGDTAADSMYFTVAREAQYKLCSDIDNLCMASRIFETCDRNEDMQNTDNGSDGIHALQKTYNRIGSDAAENILKFIGETSGDKFTTVSLFDQGGAVVENSIKMVNLLKAEMFLYLSKNLLPQLTHLVRLMA